MSTIFSPRLVNRANAKAYRFAKVRHASRPLASSINLRSRKNCGLRAFARSEWDERFIFTIPRRFFFEIDRCKESAASSGPVRAVQRRGSISTKADFHDAAPAPV